MERDPVDTLQTIRKIVQKMMTARKYDFNSTAHQSVFELYPTYQEFQKFFDKEGGNILSVLHQLKEIYTKAKPITNGENNIIILWYNDLRRATIKYIADVMAQHSTKHSIVIYFGKKTSYAPPAIREFSNAQNIQIEIFEYKELMFDVTEHVLVPRHIICSPETKAAIIKDYAVTKDQLPKIRLDNPVCKFIGAKRGNLIKIVRNTRAFDIPSDALNNTTLTPMQKNEHKNKKLYDITYRLVV